MLVAEQQDSQHRDGCRQEPFEYRLPSFNLLKVEDSPKPGDLSNKIEQNAPTKQTATPSAANYLPNMEACTTL